MKIFLLILSFFIFNLTNAQSPTWQWAKRTGSTGDNINTISGNEAINDVKVDKSGNIYAVGNFFANTAFQNAQLFGQTTPLGYGQEDAYLMKYSSCGSLLWYRRMGGTNVDAATSLLIDNSGKVVVTGYSFSNPSVYSGGTNTITINSTNSNGGQFIAKFDTSGALLTVNTYSYDYTKKILLNSLGNYIITNGLSAAVINTLGVVTSTMAFITPTPFYPSILGIAIDKNDNLYFSGSFNNTINIGPGTTLLPTPSTLIPNTIAPNSLVMKFNQNGIMQWHQRGFTQASDGLIGCTIDTSGTIVALGGGARNGTTVFGYLVNGGVGSAGNVFYRLSTSTGSLLSGITGSTNFQGNINPYATDRDNNFHCYGKINGFLAFNSTTYTSNGQTQSCIGKFDSGGNFLGIHMLPQTGSASGKENIQTITISEQGNVYVGGMFGGTLDSAGTAVNVLGGQEDGFVAKFGFACSSTVSILSPLAPSSLIATYNGTLSNLVTWVDNSNYETGFELWYNGPTPTFSLLSTLPANATSYTHTGLSYSTTYCYAARAINNIGLSAFTNTDCATTPAQTAPQAPANLIALNTGLLTNNVNWVDNSFDETSFELWYHDASPTFSLLATLPANTTTYAHSGLNYTTTYCYKALATNSIGASAFTNTDCATTPQAPLPNAPTNLTAVNNGTLINNISWVDNSANETTFELWYNDASAASFSLLATLPANTTSYAHTGLSYTTTYCYKALATNSIGASVFTNTDCATTPDEILDETGISKQSGEAWFNIYPNPTSGQVFIKFETGSGKATVTVTDAIGRVIKDEEIIMNGGTTIHKLNLPPTKGMYFVQVKTVKGVETQKVILE